VASSYEHPKALNASTDLRPQKSARSGKSNRIKAMEHPLRARILRTLVERGVMSPAQLARELGAELSDVSYHVRRLDELDCAELVELRPVRGAVEHFYRATERHLIDVDEWEQLDPFTAEDLVCGYVQRILDDFVDSRKADMVGSDKNFHISRTPLILDPAGLEEAVESYERYRLDMSEIERRSAERRHEDGTPAVPTSSSLLLFKIPRRSLDEE
jgi:DNA-binding transcriptional ArsR family regulator